MTSAGRGIGPAMAVVALMLTAPAAAQENLDSGKTGAQLYAADCALCHKNPQTLNKSGGLFGLSGFLREHYTASKESAASIAAYLQTVGNAPAPAKRTTKRTPKGDDKAKLDEDKKGKDKSGEAKGEDKAKVDAEKKDKVKSGEDKAEKSEKTGKDEAKHADGDSKIEHKPDKKAEKKAEKKSSEAKSDAKSDAKSGEAKPKEKEKQKSKDAKGEEAKAKDAKGDDTKAAPPKEAKAKKKPGSAATAKPDKPDKSD